MQENGSQNEQPTMPEKPEQLPHRAKHSKREGPIEGDGTEPTKDQRLSIPPT